MKTHLIKKIALSFALSILFIPVCLSAQISGQVVDAKTGDPLEGANVLLTPSGSGTVTDEDGYFRLPFSPKNETDSLIISFLGYQEYREAAVKYTNRSVIKLEPKSILYGDSIVVQAELFDLPRREIPHAAEKISTREIEQYGSSEISDLFKTFSSVRVEGNDLDGRFVQIRGSDPDEVNVYVDGVLINNLGFNNSADLTIVPTESIEKLEVLKGANLTLLGRGAFGGVVNINTKKRFNRSIGLRMKRGSFENRYLLSEINWPLSSKLYINYFGQFNSFVPEIEYFPGERFSDKTPSTSIKTEKQNHSLNLNYFTHGGIINAKFIGYFLDYNKPFWESRRKNYLLAFSYKGALLGMKDFDFVWNVFRSDDQLKRNPAGSANFFSGYQTNRVNIKFAKKFLLKGFEIHTLGEYIHDELDSDLKVEDQNYSNTLYNALLYENRGSIGAVFAYSDFIESVQGLSWRTFLGMRADFVSSGNNEFLPTVGFQLDWKKTLWSLSPYVNYGKNVKYPTLFENAYLRDITTTSPGDTLFKRLEPEYNNSAELGMKISYKSGGDIFRQMDIAIAVFSSTVYNKLLKRPFDDLIASAQTGRNVTRGFETSVKFHRVMNYFQVFAGYTGLNIEDPFLYPYKPDERVSFQFDFSLPVGFYLTHRYFYEGKSSAWFYDLNNNFQTVEITPFYDIDLTFGYRFNISRLNFNLQFAGYNLLDNAGFQYYYLKKRYLQVSFSVKFL